MRKMGKFKSSSAYRFGRYADSLSYIVPGSADDSGRLGECAQGFVKPECPNFGVEHGADLVVPNIRRFYLASHSRSDLLWYPGACVLALDKAHLVSRSGITGMELRPVDLYKKANCIEEIEGFVEMRVTGRVAIDLEASGVDIAYECPICGHRIWGHWRADKGLQLQGNPKSWPDVFMTDPMVTSYIFVGSRFANLILSLGLRPATLTAIEDLDPPEA